MINWKNELGVIRPEFGAGVKAFFTERLGGVSSGPWGGVDGIMGLNVGSRVGDNSSCVRMNRSIVADLCHMKMNYLMWQNCHFLVKALLPLFLLVPPVLD